MGDGSVLFEDHHGHPKSLGNMGHQHHESGAPVRTSYAGVLLTS